MIFYITIISLFFCPIISFIMIILFRKKKILLMKVKSISLFIVLIQLVSFFTEITFVNQVVDFLFLSIFYLAIWIILWSINDNKTSVFYHFRNTLVLLLVILNYLICTVGFIGIGLILGDKESKNKTSFNNNIVCKEYNLGNALDSDRGYRVAIYKKFSLLPIEKFIVEKSYYIHQNYHNSNLEIIMNYDKNNITLYNEVKIKGKIKSIKLDVINF